MSIIFGIRHEPERLADRVGMFDLGKATERWASEGTFVKTAGRIGMGVQPYRTHDRSWLDEGLIFDAFGNILALDGRLDNHTELRSQLEINAPAVSDAQIMLAAFRQWGTRCFSEFVGDWALAIWSERDQSLSLARDHAGTRSLFFENRNGRLRWSTFLETFIAPGELHALDEVYISAYLCGSPARDRTPYASICAVTPGHAVVFHEGWAETTSHWECLPKGSIRYANDRDYEDRLLMLLKQAVRRRTQPGAPILAHLSGGMDSSTIVCISDLLRRESGSQDLLDTVSFFDASEPSWDERPYFMAVEAHRIKTGIHADVSKAKPNFELPPAAFPDWSLVPGLDPGVQLDTEAFERTISAGGYRAILSGLGGDELLGGVPTPLPELSDYLVAGDLSALWQQAIEWSISQRKPLFHLLWDTALYAWNAYLGKPLSKDPPPWVSNGRTFKRSAYRWLGQTPVGRSKRPATPSIITTESTWWILLDTMPNAQLLLGERREYRFPLLDRDLVEFLIEIPNEQLVRPGRRRSLMRRALKGIVPDVVLERRRKAYLERSPMHTVALAQRRMQEIVSTSLLAEMGYIDTKTFNACLHQAVLGIENRWAGALMQTCLLELWLKSGALPRTD